MIQSEIPVDQLWRMIRREAESAVARDPVFGAALSSAILDHPDFAHALAYQIGERLGKVWRIAGSLRSSPLMRSVARPI